MKENDTYKATMKVKCVKRHTLFQKQKAHPNQTLTNSINIDHAK
jgi:hypothetical protein